MAITFTSAPRKNFPDRKVLKSCLQETASSYNKKITELSYVFVSDDELLEMNVQFLQHDYFTDIITFDNSEEANVLEGDIFISKDRVDENGKNLGSGVLEEYCRVVVHGLLHLCGLKDKSEPETNAMRKAEEVFISMYREKVLKPSLQSKGNL